MQGKFGYQDILSRPWVSLGAVRGGSGELLGIETGDGGAWCHGDGMLLELAVAGFARANW